MIENLNSLQNQKQTDVQQSVVYDSAVGGRSYSHHVSLVCYRNRFYEMWSSGKINEDDVGQCVMMSVSDDGEHWSPAKELFSPIGDRGVLTSAGWYAREDGVLNAYAGFYEYPSTVRPEGDRDHVGTTLLCKTSSDGEHWSDAMDLHLPIVPNQGPHRLKNGRLMICGNVTFPYTDNPDGIHGWTLAGPAPCPVEGLQDDSAGFRTHGQLRGDGIEACEGSFFQTDDGIIHMLFRDTCRRDPSDKFLALSESFDNGTTYSPLKRTQFTDNGSKFYCMRLSDGRYAQIGNPMQRGPSRCPLVLHLSDDGEHFDKAFIIASEQIPRKFDGMYKGGIYGYPHAIEVNGSLYISTSINKEDVRIFKVSVKDLI